MQQAQAYLHENHPNQAIPEFEAAIAIDPTNVDAQANLGVLLYFKGEYEKAIPHLGAATKAQPDLWKIQALLGLAQYRTKDTSNARINLESALPHLQGQKVEAEVGDALIESYSATGELDKAGSVVTRMLEAQPTDPKLLITSYRIYSDLANNALITLALSAPHSAEMHQAMARELGHQGNDAAAVANYRQAIQINPKLPGLYFELGNLLYNSSDEKLQAQAEAEFKAALAANPNDAKSELMLGEVAERRGDLKAAYANATRAVALQPDDPDACSELAKVLISTSGTGENQADKDSLERARVLLAHALQIDPTNYIAHYRMASLDREQGKSEEAKKELAEYKKYKAIKDKLGEIFHDMRIRMDDKPEDDSGAPK